jgi:hypothetical protein
MEIQPSRNNTPLSAVDLRPLRPPTPAATDAGEFAGTEALERSLRATPDVRPDAVARGEALVNSPEYPPAKTLAALARLFAFEFGGSSSSRPPTQP